MNQATDAGQLLDAVRAALGQVIQGQTGVVDDVLTAFLAGGHVLLEGVPGVAKTLLVRCLSRALDQRFSRIQFTPDLMPADVTGVNVYEPGSGTFSFKPGPIFGDLLLADEINRAPAKTQSAMLEAMQEKQVTMDGVSHPLSHTFMVVATQNPLEYEGTYPLPEAQLDRFLMKIIVDYPSAQVELDILNTMNAMGGQASAAHEVIQPVMTGAQIVALRQAVHQIEADEAILNYIVALVRRSREQPTLAHGASPRSGLMLLHAAKARALLDGNTFCRPEDVQAIAAPVLRHRIILTPEAQIEGLAPDGAVAELVRQVPIPR